MLRGVAVALTAATVTAGAFATTTPAAPSDDTAGETIEAAGTVLGVGISMGITEARAKLEPLREPIEHAPDAKERDNKRIYWKLKETEYEWLIAWANSKGEITRLRARLRPGREKPFAEIGDLARAEVNTPEQARWNVTDGRRAPFRLIAQGQERRAVTFYMFALTLDMR